MALLKMLPKYFSIGLGSFGLASGASYYVTSINNDNNSSTPPNSSTTITTKNIQSPFFKNIEPKIILEFLVVEVL